MKKMKKYKLIRSADQRARCKKGGQSCYCVCGCMLPIASDPDLDLAGVSLAKQSEGEGVNIPCPHCGSYCYYADFDLISGGAVMGYYNTQYGYLVIAGVEFFGCDADLIGGLLAMVRAGDFALPVAKIKPKKGEDEI